MSAATLVASALGAGEKTEKGTVRECIKAVKSYRMPKAASGADGVPISVLLYSVIGALYVFGRRWMGQIRSGFSAVSFPFGKLGLCFIDDHRRVIGSVSLAMLTKTHVATGA